MAHPHAADAQEYEIKLTLYKMKMTAAAIQRRQQIFDMVKINTLPRFKDKTVDRRTMEAMRYNLIMAERTAKTEILRKRMEYNFLSEQLAAQRKNLARLKGARG